MNSFFSHVAFALAFRPFYLAAAGFAVLGIVVWSATYAGLVEPVGAFGGALGHGHEMLFGFTAAVMVGFLLTAARTWTGLPTLHGRNLAGLLGVWLLGRLAVACDAWLPGWLVAAVDMAFLPLAALAVALPILRADNRRNFAFPVILLVLAGVNGASHLSALGLIASDGRRVLQSGFDLVALLLVVIAGRVIPAFGANALPQAGIRTCVPLDRLAITVTFAIWVIDLSDWLRETFGSAVPALAACLHLARWLVWKPWKAIRDPLLWVLYLGYAWIVVYFALRALGADVAALVPEPIALHALTVGAIGTMTLGMMCRTSRGHTGRPLKASYFETALFLLVTIAALVRVAVPLLLPMRNVEAIVLSAIFWALAYGLFFLRFWPILTRPRIDGKPG